MSQSEPGGGRSLAREVRWEEVSGRKKDKRADLAEWREWRQSPRRGSQLALPTQRKSEPPGRSGFQDGGQGREGRQSALYKELNICKFLPVATERSNCPLAPNAQANRSRRPTTRRGDTEGLWSPGRCRGEDSGRCVYKDEGHTGGMYPALPLCFKNSDRSCSLLLWRKSSPSQGAQFFHGFQVFLVGTTTYMHTFIQLFPRIPQISNVKVKFKIVFKYSKDQLKTAFSTKTTGCCASTKRTGWGSRTQHI